MAELVRNYFTGEYYDPNERRGAFSPYLQQKRVTTVDGQPIYSEDGMLLPHFRTFSAIWNVYSGMYPWRRDYSLSHRPDLALTVRRDSFLRSLLEERFGPVAQYPWQIEPEDPKDQRQIDVASMVERVINRTRYLHQLRWWIQEAVWYGKSGAQWRFGNTRILGEDFRYIQAWKPLNGDKIQHHVDDVPAVYIHASDVLRFPRSDIVYTDRVPALRLARRQYRERFMIHYHQFQDPDYFEPELAGASTGVGLRHWIHWTMWVRDELFAWALDYMEKVGTLGLLIFWYEETNSNAKRAAEKAAAGQSNRNAIAMPRPASQDLRETSGAQLLPASTAGIQALLSMISEFAERHIERLIVGQPSSGKSAPVPSEQARFQADTKFQLIRSDALNAEESYTHDLVMPLAKMNYPWIDFLLRWKFAIPEPENEQKIRAIREVWSMGVDFPEAPVRRLTGIRDPNDKDEIIPGQGKMGMAGANMPGGEEGGAFQPSGNPGQFPSAGSQPNPGRWTPHVIQQGPHRGMSAFKDQVTGKIRRALPGQVGFSLKSVAYELEGSELLHYAKEDWIEDVAKRNYPSHGIIKGQTKLWRNVKTGKTRKTPPWGLGGGGDSRGGAPDSQSGPSATAGLPTSPLVTGDQGGQGQQGGMQQEGGEEGAPAPPQPPSVDQMVLGHAERIGRGHLDAQGVHFFVSNAHTLTVHQIRQARGHLRASFGGRRDKEGMLSKVIEHVESLAKIAKLDTHTKKVEHKPQEAPKQEAAKPPNPIEHLSNLLSKNEWSPEDIHSGMQHLQSLMDHHSQVGQVIQGFQQRLAGMAGLQAPAEATPEVGTPEGEEQPAEEEPTPMVESAPPPQEEGAETTGAGGQPAEAAAEPPVTGDQGKEQPTEGGPLSHDDMDWSRKANDVINTTFQRTANKEVKAALERVMINADEHLAAGTAKNPEHNNLIRRNVLQELAFAHEDTEDRSARSILRGVMKKLGAQQLHDEGEEDTFSGLRHKIHHEHAHVPVSHGDKVRVDTPGFRMETESGPFVLARSKVVPMEGAKEKEPAKEPEKTPKEPTQPPEEAGAKAGIPEILTQPKAKSRLTSDRLKLVDAIHEAIIGAAKGNPSGLASVADIKGNIHPSHHEEFDQQLLHLHDEGKIQAFQDAEPAKFADGDKEHHIVRDGENVFTSFADTGQPAAPVTGDQDKPAEAPAAAEPQPVAEGKHTPFIDRYNKLKENPDEKEMASFEKQVGRLRNEDLRKLHQEFGLSGQGTRRHLVGELVGSLRAKGVSADRSEFAHVPEININPGDVDDGFHETAGKIFGGNLTHGQLAHLAMAPEGAKVNLGLGGDEHSAHVQWEHPELGARGNREYRRDPETGQLEAHHHEFFLDDDSPLRGKGAGMFAHSVNSYRDMGIKRVRTKAIRNDATNTNGYIAWPRMGFDGPIPEEYMKKIEQIGTFKREFDENRQNFKNYKPMIQDLLQIPGGMEWWKENGGDIDLTFDTDPDSKSSRILSAYLAQKTKSTGEPHHPAAGADPAIEQAFPHLPHGEDFAESENIHHLGSVNPMPHDQDQDFDPDEYLSNMEKLANAPEKNIQPVEPPPEPEGEGLPAQSPGIYAKTAKAFIQRIKHGNHAKMTEFEEDAFREMHHMDEDEIREFARYIGVKPQSTKQRTIKKVWSTIEKTIIEAQEEVERAIKGLEA